MGSSASGDRGIRHLRCGIRGRERCYCTGSVDPLQEQVSARGLYFGATWIVSLIVIAGVLLMVLLANAVAERLRGFSRWLYAPLIASILPVFAVPSDLILGSQYGEGRRILVVVVDGFVAGQTMSHAAADVVTRERSTGDVVAVLH